MANIAARLVLIYKGTVETGTLVAAVRTRSISINRGLIDVSDDYNTPWRTLLGAVSNISVDISVDGVVELTQPTFIADAMADTLDTYTVVWDGGRTISAKFQLGNYEESGSHDVEMSYSVNLSSSGVVVLGVAAPAVAGILSSSHPDLVAMYTMENISGTTLTDATGNYDGTFLGTSPNTTPTAGLIGDSAITFSNGNNSTVNFVRLGAGGINLTGDFTIVFWIKSATGHNGRIQMGSGYPDKAQPDYIRLSSGSVFVTLEDGSSGSATFGFESGVIPSAGVWGLFGVERVGTTLKSFVGDGVYSATIGTVNASDFLLKFLGKGSSTGSVGSTESFDNVRVFDRGLTAAEITALYNEGTP